MKHKTNYFKLIISCCLLVFLTSCKKTEDTNKVVQKKPLSAITKQKIDTLNYTEYLLDSKVKKVAKSWIKYNELNAVIANLKQADLSYFKENHEILETLINTLKESIPETLNSPAIMSRLIALETKLYKLESIVNLSNTTSEDVISVIKEVLVTFSNLNLQLNKKIERESQKIIKP